MKIALIEIYQHIELIRCLTTVFNRLSYDVTVCTNSICYDLLDKRVIGLAKWIVVKDEEQWSGVIGSVALEHDLVFFTTLPYAHPQLIDAGLEKPTFCIVHNGHQLLATWKQAAMWSQPSLKNLIRLYRSLKTSKYLLKKATNERLHLTFMSREVFLYLTKKFSAQCRHLKVVEPPAFTFAEPCDTHKRSANSKLRIVVPGTLSYNAKDLNTIYQAFKLIPKNKVCSFQIIFAGKVKGAHTFQWLQRFRTLLKGLADVHYFEKHLPQVDYDQILCSADILLLPIPSRTNFAGVIEYYGTTTASGTINDAYRLNKPAIVPGYYPIPNSYQSLFKSYYEAKDLSKILREFLEGQLELSILKNEDLERNSQIAIDQIKQLIITPHEVLQQKERSLSS